MEKLSYNEPMNYTALIHKEDGAYVSFCPELDVSSQGTTIEDAKSNLKEAIDLFLEHASEEEKQRRIHSEMFVTTVST